MRAALLITLSLLMTRIYSEALTYKQVRVLYKDAAMNETSCRKLISEIKNSEQKKDHVLEGYKACAVMMLAKYTYNPFGKLSKFNEGKDLLENAIIQNPNNTELRFLRFTVQTNAPSFLGYNTAINDDKKHILNTLQNLNDFDLQKNITSFLLRSEYVSNTEKQNIKTWMNF